jgi:hypothetical protein
VERPRKNKKSVSDRQRFKPSTSGYKTEPFHSSVPFNFVGDQIKILLYLPDSLFTVCGIMALRLLAAI